MAGIRRVVEFMILTFNLRGTCRQLFTYRAYPAYFRAYSTAYFDQIDLAYYLPLVACLFHLFSLFPAVSHETGETDVHQCMLKGPCPLVAGLGKTERRGRVGFAKSNSPVSAASEWLRPDRQNNIRVPQHSR